MVAVKILPIEIASTTGGTERFQREALVLGQLRHPNIVEVYDAGRSGPWGYILMEFVAGPNLREVLGNSSLPLTDVVRIATAVGRALQFAHEHGVVHGDVKPENVLLNSKGDVKLVDFGLSNQFVPLSNTAEEAPHILGTSHYMAPEQKMLPESTDHRIDVYALGVMIYEMLTGKLPV